MSVKKIPATTQWTCDGCGAVKESGSRPAHWSQLVFARDAYDWQGAPVADGTTRRDLCRTCTDKAETALNNEFPRSEKHLGL